MAAGEPFGIFYAWWRGDPIPPLSPLTGLAIERLADDDPVPGVEGLNLSEAVALRRNGHRPYIARLDEVVGYGWVATSAASISELGIELRLSPNERYLWGFITLPAWRGQRIYPALLQAIMTGEAADRFWIGHDIGNTASASGILKAGFRPVGVAVQGSDGVLKKAGDLLLDHERARAAVDHLDGDDGCVDRRRLLEPQTP